MRVQDAAARVRAFIASFDDVIGVSATLGDAYLVVRLPVGAAEAMLGTELYVHAHTDGRRVLRARTHSLPASVAPLVHLVGGVVGAPPGRAAPRFGRQATVTGGGTAGLATPQLLAAHYDIPTGNVEAATSVSVFEIEPQSFNPADVRAGSCWSDRRAAPSVCVSVYECMCVCRAASCLCVCDCMCVFCARLRGGARTNHCTRCRAAARTVCGMGGRGCAYAADRGRIQQSGLL